MLKTKKFVKEANDKELKKLFEEEIKKPYYDVFYLDNFNLPYEKLDVSVVIPTYNRCPYKPESLKGELNPLSWAIKSLLLQKPKIREIIIANDLSEDYTEEVVKKYQDYAKEKGIEIKYVKCVKRKGISAIRNLGAKQTNGRYIMFMDDDAFLTPYAIFGAVYTFEELEKQGIRVGAINLPTYGRESHPRAALPKSEIGVIDFVKGIQKGNKDCFPLEYLSQTNGKKFLNPELQILNPIPITNMNAICLVSKKAFEEVGGFPEHVLKRMEDREFGCRLFENGYSIYYQPDPKFHCVHGSYGLHTGKKFDGEDWFKKIDKEISLKRAMKICDNPKENTGARVSPYDFIYDYILAFFVLIYDRNKRGAMKWIEKVYSEFVVEGKTDLFGNPNIPVPDENARKQMWISAINKGLSFIKEKEKKSLRKINLVIRKLRSKEQVNEIDIIGLLERLK